MRLFQNLSEAESEIRRDIAKGTPVESSRVQQRTGLKLQGRERVSYNYSIQNGSMKTILALIQVVTLKATLQKVR